MRHLLFLLAIATFALPTSAFEYMVSGELTYNSLLARPNFSETRYFDVSVQGDQWSIVSVPPETNMFIRFTHTYDGSNIIYTTQFNLHRTLNTNMNNGVVQIEAQKTPNPLNTDYACQSWLAFASGEYFRSIKDGFAQPVYEVWDERTRNNGFLTKCEVITNTHPPFLPVSVRYFYNDTYTDYFRKTYKMDRSLWGKQSLLAGQYTAGEFTNCSGLYFPTAFRWEQFWTDPQNESPTPKPMVLVTGTLHYATNRLSPSALSPDSAGWLIAADSRFAAGANGITEMSYNLQDSVVPGTNNPDLQRDYYHTRYNELLKVQRTQRSRSTFLLWVVLFLLAGYLAVFLLRRGELKNR